MKNSKIWFSVLLFAMPLVFHSAITATPLDDIVKIKTYVEEHKEIGRLTIEDFKNKKNKYRNTQYVLGTFKGIIVGQSMISSIYATPQQKQKLAYLFVGYRMPSSSYVREVDIIMQKPNNIKSWGTALVEAEANFAQSAGKYDRANKLREKMVLVKKRQNLVEKTHLLHKSMDGAKDWHEMVGLGWAENTIDGYKEGMDLVLASLYSQASEFPEVFRVGDIESKMDEIAKRDDAPQRYVVLYLQAIEELLQAASAK